MLRLTARCVPTSMRQQLSCLAGTIYRWLTADFIAQAGGGLHGGAQRHQHACRRASGAATRPPGLLPYAARAAPRGLQHTSHPQQGEILAAGMPPRAFHYTPNSAREILLSRTIASALLLLRPPCHTLRHRRRPPAWPCA